MENGSDTHLVANVWLVASQANRRIPVSHKYPPGDWTRVPHDGKQPDSPLDQWDMVWMQWNCRLYTGLSPSSRLCRLWSWKKDLQRAWNWDRSAVWDQLGLSHCWHDGLVTVWDKARLRQGHNDLSCQGHQYSKTTLTGESRFHISTLLGIEPGSLMTGSKRIVHWTSETWCECSEITGSTQAYKYQFNQGWPKEWRPTWVMLSACTDKNIWHTQPTCTSKLSTCS